MIKRCCTKTINRNKRQRAVAPIETPWANGAILRVAFMEGTVKQKEFVKRVAPQWSEHANLTFIFVQDKTNAEIRITFDESDGAWSTVGIDALTIPQGQPTMNLGWLDEAVVLHEFGHAIGLGHEHQNPVGGIKWNKEAVYKDLAGPPNFWDPETVDYNIFDGYAEDKVMATDLDQKSIMMYPIPTTWTLDDYSIGMNKTLSAMDKIFIGALYPFEEEVKADQSDDMASVDITFLNRLQGNLTDSKDSNWFKFKVEEKRYYSIQTFSDLDIYLTLYGPTDKTNKLSEDDDSGDGLNPCIVAELEPGEYYVQARLYEGELKTGSYLLGIDTLVMIEA